MSDRDHTCHSECPCHTGGEPRPDFLGDIDCVPLDRSLAHWECANKPECLRLRWVGPEKECPSCGHDGIERKWVP